MCVRVDTQLVLYVLSVISVGAFKLVLSWHFQRACEAGKLWGKIEGNAKAALVLGAWKRMLCAGGCPCMAKAG